MSLIDKIIDYLRSSKNELTKVTWPSRQDTFRYSALVISISVGVAAFFGVLDMGLSRLVNVSLAGKQMQTPQAQSSAPVEVETVPVNGTGNQTQTNTVQPKIEYTNTAPITNDNQKK